MEKQYIIEEWVIDEILDTIRIVENYHKEIKAKQISSDETCLDRKVSKSKKLLYGIKNTRPIETCTFIK